MSKVLEILLNKRMNINPLRKCLPWTVWTKCCMYIYVVRGLTLYSHSVCCSLTWLDTVCLTSHTPVIRRSWERCWSTEQVRTTTDHYKGEGHTHTHTGAHKQDIWCTMSWKVQSGNLSESVIIFPTSLLGSKWLKLARVWTSVTFHPALLEQHTHTSLAHLHHKVNKSCLVPVDRIGLLFPFPVGLSLFGVFRWRWFSQVLAKLT